MTDELLSKIDFPQLFNVLAGVIAFFVAYLRILPLIPRSANKILSDIEVYKESNDAGIEETEIIKKSIEREIKRKYRKPTRIYHYGEFLFSLISLIIISYFIYDRILRTEFDTIFFFLMLGGFISIIILMSAFNEPENPDDNEEEATEIIREPVFSFKIFSWSELFSGTIVIVIFGFWTYHILFKTGELNFSWWAILTGIIFFAGIGILAGAFKRVKDNSK
ncbi:hypothetical protein [Tenacibaculum finnmarkense]|uniref:hypothetical protein n=1 Tax=Tenacibaculum finnmarkense TaxID=2781243 RepID=UPI001E50B48D|nr:hypothetical protein [Tenacibaculum finnmarkense]MCD8413720.1 hypothetical protein [Tenacibaculum finnmarkense genomovar ulcerans]